MKRIVGTYIPGGDTADYDWFYQVVTRRGKSYYTTFYFTDGTVEGVVMPKAFIEDDVRNGFIQLVPRHMELPEGL